MACEYFRHSVRNDMTYLHEGNRWIIVLELVPNLLWEVDISVILVHRVRFSFRNTRFSFCIEPLKIK